jgi:hypothetical protein
VKIMFISPPQSKNDPQKRTSLRTSAFTERHDARRAMATDKNFMVDLMLLLKTIDLRFIELQICEIVKERKDQ